MLLGLKTTTKGGSVDASRFACFCTGLEFDDVTDVYRDLSRCLYLINDEYTMLFDRLGSSRDDVVRNERQERENSERLRKAHDAGFAAYIAFCLNNNLIPKTI